MALAPKGILVIDNRDSFTYNLVEYVRRTRVPVTVVDHHADPTVLSHNWQGIILSPGPGHPATPQDVGLCVQALNPALNIPVLGVCLGHQLMAHVLGAEIHHVPPVHGEAATVTQHPPSALLQPLPPTFQAMRYHSLAVRPGTLPPPLRVTATADDGTIMALEHTSLPWYGVQFHPESIGTPDGEHIIRHFCITLALK